MCVCVSEKTQLIKVKQFLDGSGRRLLYFCGGTVPLCLQKNVNYADAGAARPKTATAHKSRKPSVRQEAPM